MTRQKGNARNRYEPECKKEMVRLVLEDGRTIRSVNGKFNLGDGTVRDWIKQFSEESGENPQAGGLGKLYEENRRLRIELGEARKEISFLKSRRILRKGNRLGQCRFTDGYKGVYDLRWLLGLPMPITTTGSATGSHIAPGKSRS